MAGQNLIREKRAEGERDEDGDDGVRSQFGRRDACRSYVRESMCYRVLDSNFRRTQY